MTVPEGKGRGNREEGSLGTDRQCEVNDVLPGVRGVENKITIKINE